MSEEVDYLLVGAGVTSLAFANALPSDARCLILEREARPGGFCRTTRRNGFVWDHSGHFFHFRHADVRERLLAKVRDLGEELAEIERCAKVWVDDRLIDYPFQKNIHQLSQPLFLQCLHDLHFRAEQSGDASFKAMLYAKFGEAIATHFLVPYNEKLYATDLADLDKDAMGRFFPYVDEDQIIRHFVSPEPSGYNARFHYPKRGAEVYIEALVSQIPQGWLALNESLLSVDASQRLAKTSTREIRYKHLISSVPLPKLCQMTGVRPEVPLSANQVEVFNLGFDCKGLRGVHWVYVPERRYDFYRVGFYDNVFETERTSLYVEIGHPAETDQTQSRADAASKLPRLLAQLREAQLLGPEQQLVDWEQLWLDPAYVHMTAPGQAWVEAQRQRWRAEHIHSVGRYGRWTYCAIEDNIVEAEALAEALRSQG